MNLLINPLLAQDHFAAEGSLSRSLQAIIDCLEYMLPMISRRTACAYYDDAVELYRQPDNKWFPSLIANLTDKDLKRKWYLYTRNRCTLSEGPLCQGSILCNSNAVISGAAHETGLDICDNLLSFSGKAEVEENEVTIQYANQTKRYPNFATLSDISRYLPRYEASDKHGIEEYTRAGGKIVAPMRLGDGAALKLLLGSDEFGQRRLATDGHTFYAFVRTHVDNNIYHGYEIGEDEYKRIAAK